MRKKRLLVNQYIFDTKNIEENNEEFLDEIAPLIGYIVQAFNSLEQLLNSKICEIFIDDSDIFGLIVIQKLSYSAKVDLFNRLLIDFQNAVGKEIEILDKLISNLKRAGKLRNIVVHSDWESSHLDGYTMNKIIIDKKGFQYEYVQFSEKSLEKILDLINEILSMFDIYDEQLMICYQNNHVGN